ncbi:MAG: hypothetical protein GY866_20405, partial [Proteobacteria bacterium]|nr:hypothetical protein [Pseudomonadota bacterium]
EPDDQFEKHARSEADKKSWKFDKLKGDLRLFRQLVDGQWDEADFLVVPPGHTIQTAFEPDVILKAERNSRSKTTTE